MLHGIGASLARRLGPERLDVHRIPPPSRWPARGSAGRPPTSSWSAPVALPWTSSHACCSPAARIVALRHRRRMERARSTGGRHRMSAASAARASSFSERLGAPRTSASPSATAQTFDASAPTRCTRLAIEVALRTAARARARAAPTTPTRTDGQLTKRHVRAIPLASSRARAGPTGALLWDVGAGTALSMRGIEYGCGRERRPPARSVSNLTPRAPTGSSATPVALGVPDR
jgi:precorrin-6Y C5,15-methyltransferase (decarboxylating)